MDKQEKLISVIIPIFNCENTIVRCVNSILEQSYQNMEIILIDDASTDRTYKICKEYFSGNEKIIFIRHRANQGVSAARNSGLQQAKGEYISFCDADDYMDKEMLKELFCICESEDAEIAGCGIYGKPKQKEKIVIYDTKEKIMGYIMKHGGYIWNKLFRREAIKGIQFNTQLVLCEDYVFLIECIMKIKKMASLARELYYYMPGGITCGASNKHFVNGEFAYKTAMRQAIIVTAGSQWEEIFRYQCYMLAVVEKDSDYVAQVLTAENKRILEDTIIWAKKGFLKSKKVSVKNKIIYTIRDKFPKIKSIVRKIGG